jgi:hypothetical protein
LIAGEHDQPDSGLMRFANGFGDACARRVRHSCKTQKGAAGFDFRGFFIVKFLRFSFVEWFIGKG